MYRFCYVKFFIVCALFFIVIFTDKRCKTQEFLHVAPPVYIRTEPELTAVQFPFHASPYFYHYGQQPSYPVFRTPVSSVPHESFIPIVPSSLLFYLNPAFVAHRKDGKFPTSSIFAANSIRISSTSAAECGVVEPSLRVIGEGPTKDVAANNTDDSIDTLEYDGPDFSQTIFQQYLQAPSLQEGKITFGHIASKTEAPWQVAMFTGGKFHCGASLIGEYHILTAAHCVTAYKTRPYVLKLSLGDWDLKTETDGSHLLAEIESITPHPNFSFFTLQNDIAVLRLKKKVQFGSRIRSICLPPNDLKVEGALIKVTGWGRNEKNRLQSKLQKLTAAAIENNLCADKWSITGAPRSLIGTGTLCIDTQIGDSCKGDSGGPAAFEYPEGSGKYYQVGIVSFGSGSCTDKDLPGVYTRVASFRQWILDNMN